MKLYVSPSEMETWFLCKRKWAGIYIHGWRGPEKPAAAKGVRTHRHLEKYLRDGTPPDMSTEEGEIAAESLHILPAPGTVGVEQAFAFAAPGAWFTGVKDFVARYDTHALIGDHKTTGDKRWIKTEEELLSQPQAPIYAVDEFRRNARIDVVEAQWNYHLTKRPFKVIPVHFLIRRKHATELFFDWLLPEANIIEELHGRDDDDTPHMLEMPGTFTACNAFGGCHLKHICNPTPAEQLGAIMSQGLLAKIRSGAIVGATAPVYAPPASQAQPPSPSQAPGAPPAAWDQAFQQQSAPPPTPPQWTPPAAATAPPGATPWQAPAPVQVQSEAPQQYQQSAPPPWTPPVVAAPAATPWTPPPRVEEATRKRGKRKTAEKIDGGDTTEVVEAGEESEGFTLYINCRPVNGEVTSAFDYCEAAHTLLKEEQSILHYGLIEYGKGKPALQIALSKVLQNNDPLSGDVILLDTEIEKDCLPVFKALASKVVVGL